MKRIWPILLGFLLLAVPAAVQAQSGSGDGFDYSINASNANTITITGVTGEPVGAVTIPTNINGLTVTVIGDGTNNAFGESGEVTSVTIPGSVTSIGDDAFVDLYLSSVTIPASVTSIGNFAFYDCQSLPSVTIPASVTNIGAGAFAECYGLTTITVNSSNSSYSSTNGILFNKIQSTLVEYPSVSGSYTIPTNVSSIAADAFYLTRLSSVTIPTNVTNIGFAAFAACTNLTTITVDALNSYYSSSPAGVLFNENQSTLIQYPCNDDYSGATTIPSSVTTIGSDAFYYGKMSSVTIPASVTNIGDEAFAYCPYLTTITVSAQNSFYSSVNGVLFDKSQDILIQYPGGLGGSYLIPSSVISIGDFAFSGTGVTNVTVPGSVTSIGYDVFEGCGRLTSITIPGSVTNIGAYAFVFCFDLTSYYFLGNAPTVGLDSLWGGMVYYPYGTTGWSNPFAGLPAVEEQQVQVTASPTNGTVPLTVQFNPGTPGYTPNWNFDDGSTSTSQSPSHVYTNAGTFYPSLVATNGYSAVLGSGPSITVSSPTVQFTASPTNGTVSLTVQFTSPSLDSQSNTITRWFWSFGDGSTSTLQNPSHTYTTAGTFQPSLVATNRNGFEVLGSGPSISANGYSNQFYYSVNNGTITIIGYTCAGGAVTIPSTIHGMTVTSIGDSAFVDCDSLTSIIIPNSVTNIGEESFFGCMSLTNVTIGTNVTSIGNLAFNGCPSLIAITVNAGNSAYISVNGVLFNESQTMLIQYPEGKVGSYSVPSSVTSIGDVAFEDCANLPSVTIPNSVTSIGVGAFEDAGLTSVTIPNSVTSVGDDAFYGCNSLTNLIIGSGVTYLGISPFGACSSLTAITVNPGNLAFTSVNGVLFNESQTTLIQFPGGLGGSYMIPNSVASVAPAAFAGNASLTNVTIPNSVTSIGEFAFVACSNLTAAYFLGNAPTDGNGAFISTDNATVYYLPGTSGWSSTYGGVPAVLWVPQAQTSGASFGVQSNQFGFNITWASGMAVVVQACTNLADPVWTPLLTNTLTNGSYYFSEPLQTNSPGRYYRIISP